MYIIYLFTHFVILQVFLDHQELLGSLKAGTSDRCCFKNHDITTTNVVFQSEDDAVSTAQTLFVRITTIVTINPLILSVDAHVHVSLSTW